MGLDNQHFSQRSLSSLVTDKEKEKRGRVREQLFKLSEGSKVSEELLLPAMRSHVHSMSSWPGMKISMSPTKQQGRLSASCRVLKGTGSQSIVNICVNILW